MGVLPDSPPGEILPPPERARHDRVERVTGPIVDAGGYDYAQPHRVVGILERLERRGVIDRDMGDAGEGFAELFRRAHLDPLRAANLLRTPGARSAITQSYDMARRRLHETIASLGGMGSLAGSCCWHVLGLEQPLRQWALSHAGIREDEARGVLRVALQMLAGQARGRQRRAVAG